MKKCGSRVHKDVPRFTRSRDPQVTPGKIAVDMDAEMLAQVLEVHVAHGETSDHLFMAAHEIQTV